MWGIARLWNSRTRIQILDFQSSREGEKREPFMLAHSITDLESPKTVSSRGPIQVTQCRIPQKASKSAWVLDPKPQFQ